MQGEHQSWGVPASAGVRATIVACESFGRILPSGFRLIARGWPRFSGVPYARPENRNFEIGRLGCESNRQVAPAAVEMSLPVDWDGLRFRDVVRQSSMYVLILRLALQ